MNSQNIILLVIMVLLFGIGFYLRARKTEKIEKSFVIYMAITMPAPLLHAENLRCIRSEVMRYAYGF